MTYSETIEYLFSQLPMYQRQGKAAYKADLSNTLALCAMLGNPEKKFKSIHIAGTNGKGSTSHFIASILQEAGYRIGLYTSPHLKDFRERIRINGEMIPEQEVVDFVKSKHDLLAGIEPSFFEWTVGLAFDYFASQKVDIAVIETGLGGRLDSTNVITPLVSVITNIGLDHTQFLGNTLQQVAMEKSGIIKSKVPVVIGETQEETTSVFLTKAEEQNAPILFADQQGAAFANSNLVNYQKKNAQTASQAIIQLQKKGFVVTKKNVIDGVLNMKTNTGLRGRWEVLKEQPLVVADTAHNKEGLAYTMQQIQDRSYSNLRIVFGMVNDKDVASVINMLPQNAIYYLCQPSIARALPVEELADIFNTTHHNFSSYSTPKLALEAALSDSQKDDVIYVGGSTFIVADIL